MRKSDKTRSYMRKSVYKIARWLKVFRTCGGNVCIRRNIAGQHLRDAHELASIFLMVACRHSLNPEYMVRYFLIGFAILISLTVFGFAGSLVAGALYTATILFYVFLGLIAISLLLGPALFRKR
jgi:uncharacterized membrane protein YtjA (UPF0391 family)